MEQLLSNMRISISERVYVKDPVTSDLGQRIVLASLDMIEQHGLESFTFGKLARELGTTESSIYRYFENKHKLLIYLSSWYWGYLEYKVAFATSNVADVTEKLKRGIHAVMEEVDVSFMMDFIPVHKLRTVVVSESAKAYLTKQVDESNKHGCYSGYKRLVGSLSDIVLEIDPNFAFPHALISTMIEGFHHQIYFAAHLPKLTDEPSQPDGLINFYQNMVLSTVTKPKNED